MNISQNSIWVRAQTVDLSVSEEIQPGFNIGFDKKIPETLKSELCAFVEWIENNYRVPITFWVDFEYKKYLIRRDGKHAGYLFYWPDVDSYPEFKDPAKIPSLRLPVREKLTIEEILTSFIGAIMCYYAWICNEMNDSYDPVESEVDAVLQEYLCARI